MEDEPEEKTRDAPDNQNRKERSEPKNTKYHYNGQFKTRPSSEYDLTK